jgi:HAD superfamily hydrolase (TIGR01549 family)
MNKIITFDIWDTLIKRKCHPEEIKLFTAKYMLLKYNKEIKEEYKDIYSILKERNNIESILCKKNEEEGFSQECRILDVFNSLQDKIFVDKKNYISEELLRVEIEHEKEMIYVNEEVFPILDEYKDMKMYCVSDFYMDSNSLKEILASVGIDKKFEKIYSSADTLLTKRSGRLYKLVEEELKVKPEDHIHVGDNEYVDIQKAKELGIQTIHISNKSKYDFELSKNRKINFNLQKLKLKEIKDRQDKLYNLGIELSPLLYFYVEKIIEYAIKNKIEKIYYQTREGETFIKIHEMIKQHNIYGVKIPECDILEVSRIATFSPSLSEISIAELLRAWSQYRVQSLKAIFKTIGIQIDKYKSYIEKYGIDETVDIWEPWFDIKVQELFRDEEFKSKINEEIKEKREELIKFFEKKGIYKDKEPLFVVDMGWRGTIQDNLAYIYNEKKIGGYYYALFDYYNVQPENSYKLAFIEDRQVTYEYIGPMITVFEMLFNTESGSVIGYKDGQAKRKVKEEEYNTVVNMTSHIQRGMLEGSKVINEYLKCHPYENSEFNMYIYNLIKNMKTNPSKDLVDVYYSLIHNDTFGTGEYVDKRMKLSIIEKMNLIRTRNLLRKEQWKEAFMIHNNTKVLRFILSFKSNIRKIFRRIK